MIINKEKEDEEEDYYFQINNMEGMKNNKNNKKVDVHQEIEDLKRSNMYYKSEMNALQHQVENLKARMFTLETLVNAQGNERKGFDQVVYPSHSPTHGGNNGVKRSHTHLSIPPPPPSPPPGYNPDNNRKTMQAIPVRGKGLPNHSNSPVSGHRQPLS